MKTRVCKACGEKVKNDALRCKSCGEDLGVKKCEWCMEIIEEDAKRCKHCKSFVDKLPCEGCGKEVEESEMRCADCVEKIIEEEVNARVEEFKRSMNLKNWLILAILVALAAYALSQIF